jgi:hypothetical protein
MTPRWPLRSIPFVLVLLCAALTPALAAETPCIRAEIEAPIILPDGTEHAGGTLTMCLERDFSPVVALHEVSIDRVSVGLMRSWRGESEGPAEDAPYLMFVRREDGRLELYGFALPGTGAMQTFLMRPLANARADLLRVDGT